MEYERGAENLPVDTNMSTGSSSATATHVAREGCPNLADQEWEELQRLATVIGDEAVATMLRTLSPTEQHGGALRFIMKEQREIAAHAKVSVHTAHGVIETPRGQLRWRRGWTSPPLACRSRHCHHGSAYARPVVEGCVRHVMSWRTSKELGVWTPTHGSYVL
ncbi:unnamed protein product [Phytophthora fragariaefolia]|uniref:Unnamed protein product n=1 Tax=Phytophthora fragariaefolia TaxID=1490495 RepID=A0A9W6YGH9_9STRA|nr:unnamed protein product [Phytophthora fragariaefolia]